jgi:hypothetical protein
MPALRSRESLPAYLPLIDPDHFREASFYRELEAIGYRTILLGGTGGARMREAIEAVRASTSLRVVIHPSSPGEVLPADLVILPVVMNSNSHYTRPFGSGAVMCAMAVAEQELPYLPAAYFVLGESTARWYTDAFLVRSKKVVMAYATYAAMTGYDHLFLDYEDPDLQIDWDLVTALKRIPGMKIVVSDEFDPERAREGRTRGIDTVITPSDILEEARDPLALAREFHAALLAE